MILPQILATINPAINTKNPPKTWRKKPLLIAGRIKFVIRFNYKTFLNNIQLNFAIGNFKPKTNLIHNKVKKKTKKKDNKPSENWNF